jgi:hypothetical protein
MEAASAGLVASLQTRRLEQESRTETLSADKWRRDMNIIDKSDEEILEIAHPLWDDLISYSNKGQYGKFIRKFSYELLLGLNEVELGKQFAHSSLSRNLVEEREFLGLIRRGEHVTVLYRVRSSTMEGEWLGRMVLGYEKGEVRIFAASIF